MTNLRDTVNLMNSEDYKERFIAEYWQTKIRYEKLKAFNTRIEAEETMKYELTPHCKALSVKLPKHNSCLSLLREQQGVMGNYLHILELRAVIEGIDLDTPIKYQTEGSCK